MMILLYRYTISMHGGQILREMSRISYNIYSTYPQTSKDESPSEPKANSISSMNEDEVRACVQIIVLISFISSPPTYNREVASGCKLWLRCREEETLAVEQNELSSA